MSKLQRLKDELKRDIFRYAMHLEFRISHSDRFCRGESKETLEFLINSQEIQDVRVATLLSENIPPGCYFEKDITDETTKDIISYVAEEFPDIYKQAFNTLTEMYESKKTRFIDSQYQEKKLNL